MGILASGGIVALHRLASAGGVSAARQAVAALVREAQGRAVARGGARIVLEREGGRASLEAGGAVLRALSLGDEFGVRLDLGGAEAVELVFDPAGVGRMTARTLGFERGGARSRLVISAYGRVRP